MPSRSNLVIYYWAIAVALPADRIQHMIDDVVVPEEEGLEPMPAG